jgi:uncharacterized membrane protein YhiD involved in acid resistance
MEKVMSIMHVWYQLPTAVAFTYMVLSPTKFFKQVDTYVLRESETEDETEYTTEFICQGETMEDILRDERVLNNITMMISNAKNSNVKQLWEVKKAEFERALRWKRITLYN